MFISEIIKNEKWNGGNWMETTCEYGFYSISINPKDSGDSHPRLIVVIDDPRGDEKPFVRIIPDFEVKELNEIDTFVNVLWELCGIENGEIFEEYRNDFSLRKFNVGCWQVLYKGEVVGEYDTAEIARKNVKYRIDNNWGEKVGDALLEERKKLSEKCAEITKQLKGEL